MIGFDGIRDLTSVEMIRDGGSLAACFTDHNDERHWLFFKVERAKTKHEESRRPGFETGDSVRIGYTRPVIQNRSTNERAPLSWTQARAFLHELRPLLSSARQSSAKWWEAMIRVAESEGAALPDDPTLGANYSLEYWGPPNK